MGKIFIIMSKHDFKLLMKFLLKTGYPTDNFEFVTKSINYDTNNFLRDMVESLGEDGAYDFVNKALDEISDENGIRVDLKNIYGTDSWVYIIVDNFNIDLDESGQCILMRSSWGKSRIEHPHDGVVATVQEIESELDMGDYSDYYDFLDSIRDEANEQISSKTGFCFWWE